MKRNCLIASIVCLSIAVILTFLIACSGITISGQDEISQAAATIIARRIGVGFAEKNADLRVPASVFCDLVITGEITDETVAIAKQYLEANLAHDPLLMADLNDLLKLVSLDTNGGQLDIGLIRAAAQGFKAGLQINMGVPG